MYDQFIDCLYFMHFSWLEFWQRKQRQYICRSQTWSEDIFEVPIRSIQDKPIDCSPKNSRLRNELREVTCSNKNSELLLEVRFNKSFVPIALLNVLYSMFCRYLNRN